MNSWADGLMRILEELEGMYLYDYLTGSSLLWVLCLIWFFHLQTAKDANEVSYNSALAALERGVWQLWWWNALQTVPMNPPKTFRKGQQWLLAMSEIHELQVSLSGAWKSLSRFEKSQRYPRPVAPSCFQKGCKLPQAADLGVRSYLTLRFAPCR